MWGVAVINNPGLREIALKIVSAPGFRTDPQGMRRALRQWFESVTPQQRHAAEQLFVIRWLEDVHAEFLKDQGHGQRAAALTASRTVAGQVVASEPPSTEEGAAGPDLAPGSVLRFSSESPDWSRENTDAPPPVERPASPVVRREPRRVAGPVTVTRVPERSVPAAAPVAAVESAGKREHAVPTRPASVQQPTRKSVGWQRRFPELTFAVQVPGGVKPRGEFGVPEIDFRLARIGEQCATARTAKVGEEARNEDLERRLARGRSRVAEISRNMRDLAGEEGKLTAARREMVERGCARIWDLPPEVLAACGFNQRQEA